MKIVNRQAYALKQNGQTFGYFLDLCGAVSWVASKYKTRDLS